MGYIAWLDWCKVFAIYLVILGHFPVSRDFTTEWVYSFHIPLFFLISGMLSNKKCISLKTFLSKMFTSLLLPYYMLSMCAIPVDYAINGGGGEFFRFTFSPFLWPCGREWRADVVCV